MRVTKLFVLKTTIAFISPLLLIIFLICVVFPVGSILDDFAAGRFMDQMISAPLPADTEIVEALSGCDNTSGTGDHAEIWAALLLKTDLAEHEIFDFYDVMNQNTGGHINVHKVITNKKYEPYLPIFSKNFGTLESISDYNGFYIVEQRKTAPFSLFDGRGY